MQRIIYSYKDLIVWQKSIKLVAATYELTENFPKEERYGLSSQMRRAAVSIPSNIAEGRGRGTRKDYINFLRIAFGSASELESQIITVKILPFGKNLDYNLIEKLLNEVIKMLYSMIIKMNPKANEACEASAACKVYV